MPSLPLSRKSTLKQKKTSISFGFKQINVDFSVKTMSHEKDIKFKITLDDNNNIYVSETYLMEHKDILQLIKNSSNCTRLIDILTFAVNRNFYEIEYENNEYVILFKVNTGHGNIKYRYVCSLYHENDINDIITAVNDVSI